MEIVNWIVENWVEIVAAFGGAVVAFSTIAKITPTEVDDGIALKLLKLVDFLAFNNTPTVRK